LGKLFPEEEAILERATSRRFALQFFKVNSCALIGSLPVTFMAKPERKSEEHSENEPKRQNGSEETAAGVPTPAPHPVRVLVVDDNADGLATLQVLFTMMGHQVFTARNGGEALQTAMDQRPDVVFLDIGLPVLNGYQVAERIRATPELKETVLVALTGYGLEEDRKRSRQAGFDYHVVKPGDPQQFRQLLSAVGKKFG
jgi:CheY-like chemotaxis protein